MGIALSGIFEGRKAFGFDYIEHHVLEQRDVFSRLLLSDAVVVFVHEHIFDIVETVLNAPVIANQGGRLLSRLHAATQDVVVGLFIRAGFVSRLVLAIAPTPEHDKANNARIVLLPLLGSRIESGVAVLEATPVLLLALVLAQRLFTNSRLFKAAKEVTLISFYLQAVVITRFDKNF